MRVAILGAGGQLACDLHRVLADRDLTPLRHADLDVREHNRVRQILGEVRPEVVINTAAFHRVDDCEDEVEKAFAVNTFAVRNLAQVCADLDCTLVQISTDYVFSGEKQTPYTEEDLPKPLNVYGVSKLAGEYFVRNLCPKHYVVLTSGLYGLAGSSGKGGNFVETMIRLANEDRPIRVVDDQVLTPTYTADVAEALKRLVQTGAYGLYHITNRGECSWYQFANKIFELSGLDPDFGRTTTEAFAARARRPSYSVLAGHGLGLIGLEPLRHWSEALASYIGVALSASKTYLRSGPVGLMKAND